MLQIATTHLLQLAFYPQLSLIRSKVATAAAEGDGFFKLWYLGLVLVVFFVAEQMGTLNVLQGVTKICGYNVSNQLNRVWLSTSFLDVWRRGSYNSRLYMMNYFFMPTYIRTRSVFLANASVWGVYGISAILAYGGLNWKFIKPGIILETWVVHIIKFFIIYLLASYIEMRLADYFSRNNNQKKHRGRYWIYRTFMFILMLVVYVVGNELGATFTSEMSQVFLTLYRMFGLVF